jgi:hypothetical protein
MSFRLCGYLKEHGLPCGSPALRGQSLCYFHRRHQRERLAFVQDRRRAEVCDWQLPPLNSLYDIRRALHRVLNELSSGRLDPDRAGHMLYATQQAALPFRNRPGRGNAGP